MSEGFQVVRGATKLRSVQRRSTTSDCHQEPYSAKPSYRGSTEEDSVCYRSADWTPDCSAVDRASRAVEAAVLHCLSGHGDPDDLHEAIGDERFYDESL
jgi:hypothetical protein